MFKTENLTLPAIIFDTDASVKELSIYENLMQLKVATSLSLKQRTLNDCVIIDSSGKVFVVTEVKKLSKRGPFWDFINPTYNIELNLNLVAFLENIETLKLRLLDTINNDSIYWSENTDIRRLKKILKSSKNLEKILTSISNPPM
ncbi:hypothetical protein LVD15_18960 [Fulvivirga maritima]|uniref:hypothetical protein n=1 Tax=Fulvivirga maritima TaxID=2904247 RepID=UPI001F35ACCD|nr:hypothetical protein [Fulvivirga maritima]UII25366.1 hypothetical protein LVD15_18960 [Fulvivirga maritima]